MLQFQFIVFALIPQFRKIKMFQSLCLIITNISKAVFQMLFLKKWTTYVFSIKQKGLLWRKIPVTDVYPTIKCALCRLYTLILRTDLLMTELLLSEKLFFFLQNPSESWVDVFSNNSKTFQIMWIKSWSYLTKIAQTNSQSLFIFMKRTKVQYHKVQTPIYVLKSET